MLSYRKPWLSLLLNQTIISPLYLCVLLSFDTVCLRCSSRFTITSGHSPLTNINICDISRIFSMEQQTCLIFSSVLIFSPRTTYPYVLSNVCILLFLFYKLIDEVFICFKPLTFLKNLSGPLYERKMERYPSVPSTTPWLKRCIGVWGW